MIKMIEKLRDKQKTESQIAYEMYEKSYTYIKNGKWHETEKHHVSHPNRVEHDLSEIEKAHFNLLRAKLDLELSKEAKKSNERLQIAAWVLSLALVIAAIFELFQ